MFLNWHFFWFSKFLTVCPWLPSKPPKIFVLKIVSYESAKDDSRIQNPNVLRQRQKIVRCMQSFDFSWKISDYVSFLA